MLITSAEEIRAFVPASVYNADEGLLSLTQDAEETYLVPILGRPLYNKVNELYAQAMGRDGSVLPTPTPGDTSATPEVQLIRLCQMPVIYFALANNTGLLSVSLNSAGLNRVSTQDYDPADEKAIQQFKSDAWRNAQQGIDRLLLFLEEDARRNPAGENPPSFADLWRESAYFFHQGDLLITTATDMQRFLDIKSDRQQYIAMLPDLRFCQDNYIAPGIGEELLDALVKSQTDPSVIPGLEPDGDGEEGNGQPEPTEVQGSRNLYLWNRTLGYLRTALALFVECRRPEKQRRYSENEAYLALNRATAYIKAHQEAFGTHITDSPLYVPPLPPAAEGDAAAQPAAPLFDHDDPNNAIFVFGRGEAYNRH